MQRRALQAPAVAAPLDTPGIVLGQQHSHGVSSPYHRALKRVHKGAPRRTQDMLVSDQVPDLFFPPGYLPPDYVWRLVTDGVDGGTKDANMFFLRRGSMLFDLMCVSRSWALFVLRRVLVALRCHRHAMRLHTEEFLFVRDIRRLVGKAGSLLPADSATRKSARFLVNAFSFDRREFNCDAFEDSSDDSDAEEEPRGEPVELATVPGSSEECAQFYTVFARTVPPIRPLSPVTVPRVVDTIGPLPGVHAHSITVCRQRPREWRIGALTKTPALPVVVVVVRGWSNTLRLCRVFREQKESYSPESVAVYANARPLSRLRQGALYLNSLLRLAHTLCGLECTGTLNDEEWNTRSSYRNLVDGSHKKTFKGFWNKRCIGCGCRTNVIPPGTTGHLCMHCMNDAGRPGLQRVSKTEACRFLEGRGAKSKISLLPYVQVCWRVHLVSLRDVMELNSNSSSSYKRRLLLPSTGSAWADSLF